MNKFKYIECYIHVILEHIKGQLINFAHYYVKNCDKFVIKKYSIYFSKSMARATHLLTNNNKSERLEGK